MGGLSSDSQCKVITGDGGYVLEDVPHLTDYISDLTVWLCVCVSVHFSVCLRVLREVDRCYKI